MNMDESQFETGRMEAYKRDFHKTGTYHDDGSGYFGRPKKFDFTNSVETSESKERLVFRIPLSEVSLENLKIISSKGHIIVQSDKKTIFLDLDQKIRFGKPMISFKDDMLIIELKNKKKNSRLFKIRNKFYSY
ncbi:hypothetical protein QT06_C0001G0835 [archaeon GW2011_AR15]|nr:hypothetical protein QT06_C0001G0835 [archaeon GW2011_AR15]